MQKKDAKEILDRYNNGKATEADKVLVEKWYDSLNNEKKEPTEEYVNEVQRSVYARLPIHEYKTKSLWQKIAAAAAILIIIGLGGYYYIRPSENTLSSLNRSEQILPKQAGIVLTLSNGKRITIDQRHHGEILTTDGTTANQSGDSLIYKGKTTPTGQLPQTLTNNSGSKFFLTLADGTEAYLDVQSSITFPAIFSENTRSVAITGQAYFKVKHHPGHPFFVHVRKQIIEDIGTEFNINAYDNEPEVKTTLVKGEVKINNKLSLKPGEQALSTDTELKMFPADMEVATAWLHGKIVFHHESLESILKKVARVYDMKILWADPDLKYKTFGGSVSRTKKLSTVLDFFRTTGETNFEVAGKTITVLKPKKTTN